MWTNKIRECSALNTVFSGVPQGSSLGLVLFLLYINEIPLPIDHRLTYATYADDTAIIATSLNTELTAKLLPKQTDITLIYLKSWGLKNNALKTQPIMFNRKMKQNRVRLKIKIDGQDIDWKD